MGREIKFDYILKNNIGFHHKKYTLMQIECGLINLFDIENYDLVAKRQFAGLKDKNGVEIYEGDILRGLKGNLFVCEFLGAGFKFCQLNGKRVWSSSSTKSITIIGNIYQNPDLLEQ